MELVKPQEAAARIGVSYPTLKQWIYKGKVESVRTPGGHHRIPEAEIARLTGERQAREKSNSPVNLDAISGRNKLRGTVVKVEREGLLAQITLDIGGQVITSIITRDSCEALGLRPGVLAFALVKATEVMVVKG